MMELLRGFAGAHGTYEREELNADKGKQEIKRTARTVRRPVTPELWEQHLAGEYHLGVITITEEDTCWWAVVDVDDYQVSHVALLEQLRGLSIPAMVCRTKSGGAHVYLFFSEAIAAREVMPRMRQLAALLGHGGSEVFPKQTHVATEQEGMGNWLNMPYFGGDGSANYAVTADGRGMSVATFLKAAEHARVTRAQFLALRLTRAVEGWKEAPPCLEYLVGQGKIPGGVQNNALFSLGVLAKKMHGENWPEVLTQWSQELFEPVHDRERVNSAIRSLTRRDYNYKCHDAPCVNHCNMALCRTRKYGVGAEQGGADIIESVSVLDTEPPLFYVLLKTGGTVECSGPELLNPQHFMNHAIDKLQMVLPQYTKVAWLAQVQQAVESAVKIEAPPEVGTTGQLLELLEKFCTDRHAAERREEILGSKPWRDDESGMVWFRLRDLQEFLERARFTGLRRSQVTERIKKLGGTHGFFNMMGKGVNVWGVPITALSWSDGSLQTPASEESPV
jgi:hypothetical protein